MADQANSGRLLVLKKNSTALAGLRNVTLSWAGESIDITSGDDTGKRTLLAASSQEQIDISADGISKEDLIRDIALGSSSKMLTDIELEFPIVNDANSTKATITGNFRLVSYEETGAYQDAVTFSLSLQSSGAWTYTDEAV